MTDIAYQPPPYGAPAQARDATGVMGRRILAWVIDMVLYLAFAIALFALLAEYVEVPSGFGGTDVCSILQEQDSDAASGCFHLDDRAYVTSASDNGIQTLGAIGYFIFFVVLQGVTGGSPGKLLTGLRVVNEQGTNAGIGKSLVRSLLWIVDAAPWFVPLVGFIVGLTSTGHRRIGDMVAKTYVVSAKDVGTPPQPMHGATPYGAQPWGAPAPGMPPSSPPQGVRPPPVHGTQPPQGQGAQLPPTQITPDRAPPTPSPQSEAPPPGQPLDPAVPESVVPDISGVPGETPAPPTTAGISSPPEWDEAPSGLDTPPPDDTGPTLEAGAPSTESATPTDESPPEIGADPGWWSGPEAADEPDAPAGDAGVLSQPPTEATDVVADHDPAPPADETWSPPTTPNADFGTTDDASPTAGPTPFVAPGTDPRAESPSTPQANPAPPPQWDQARNTYIQWDPNQQMWLQWDTVANRWKLIDT